MQSRCTPAFELPSTWTKKVDFYNLSVKHGRSSIQVSSPAWLKWPNVKDLRISNMNMTTKVMVSWVRFNPFKSTYMQKDVNTCYCFKRINHTPNVLVTFKQTHCLFSRILLHNRWCYIQSWPSFCSDQLVQVHRTVITRGLQIGPMWKRALHFLNIISLYLIFPL